MHHGGANPPSPMFPRVWWGEQKRERNFLKTEIMNMLELRNILSEYSDTPKLFQNILSESFDTPKQEVMAPYA